MIMDTETLTRTDHGITATVDMVIIPARLGPTFHLTSPAPLVTSESIMAEHRTAAVWIDDNMTTVHIITESATYIIQKG